MVKKFISFILAFVISVCGASWTPLQAGAEAPYDQVAGEGETATAQEVGVEGMEPIYGKDVADGTYDVEVECSSSMFPVEKAQLTVEDGEMTAILTMGGKGYLKVFMGTGREAAESDLSQYIDFAEDEEGKHIFTIPVEALDLPIECAAFSKNKEKWYDRAILFLAESLPEGAVRVELPDYEALRKAAKEKRIAALRAESSKTTEASESTEEAQPKAEPAFLELEDGEYAIQVELEGGTGRTTVTTPAGLIIQDGLAYARLEWSSTNYDYMLVDGEKFFPINEEGYSTFEIPITVFDKPMEVVADTVAMSTPHEIDYQLIFHADGILSKDQTPQAAAQRMVWMVLLIIAVCVLVSWLNKRKRNSVR